MADIIRIKRGLKADVDSITLRTGEIAFATDTKRFYIGTTEGNIDLLGTLEVASQTDAGLMSPEDKTRLDTIYNVFGEGVDADEIINKLTEVLTAFENLPEDVNIKGMKDKLDTIEEGSEVNIIEGVIIDGTTLTLDGNRKVTIPLANDTD